MKFNDNGTISVGIDDKTYTLRRPTIGQLDEYSELLESLRAAALEQLTEWNERLEADPDDADEIRAEMASASFGLDRINEPWLRKAFETLGSAPLPDSLDGAPSEWVSPDLIPQILAFWREVPLRPSLRRQ